MSVDFTTPEEHIVFLAPNEDDCIAIVVPDATSYLDEEDAIHLRDWLLKLYPL